MRKKKKIFQKKGFSKNKRDFLLITLAVIISFGFLSTHQYLKTKKYKKIKAAEERSNQMVFEKLESENTATISNVLDSFDSENWKIYQSNWYGFKIKYPEDWNYPTVKKSRTGSSAEHRLFFSPKNSGNQNFIGFDVAIYGIKKTEEINKTDEFPKPINFEKEIENTDIYLIETGDYPAEEVYIPPKDSSYPSTLFFSIIKDQYIYNITPVLRNNADFNGDTLIVVSDELPEFFESVASFENTEIIRPTPQEIARANTLHPVSFKKDSLGRLVCAKKKDKPSMSKKTKHKHLDMECCLDPDEYPNPHCYYPLDKYGELLK